MPICQHARMFWLSIYLHFILKHTSFFTFETALPANNNVQINFWEQCLFPWDSNSKHQNVSKNLIIKHKKIQNRRQAFKLRINYDLEHTKKNANEKCMITWWQPMLQLESITASLMLSFVRHQSWSLLFSGKKELTCRYNLWSQVLNRPISVILTIEFCHMSISSLSDNNDEFWHYMSLWKQSYHGTWRERKREKRWV